MKGLLLPRLALLWMAALALPAEGLAIKIDYSLDTQGFFAQPGSREALEEVAEFLGEIFRDSLDPIVPGGGNTWTPRVYHPATGVSTLLAARKDMLVPKNTIIIFAGGRVMNGPIGSGGPGGYNVNGYGDWHALVKHRRQPGATDAVLTSTDFGLWGGAISFDMATNWNFTVNGRPTNSKYDFVSVALHEMCHVLGFGTANSFKHYVSGTNFAGPASKEVWGGVVPLAQDQAHWRRHARCVAPLGYDPANPNNVLSLTYGSFGRAHGLPQIALMDPASCLIPTRNYLQVLTDLDLAALRDIGWEMVAPPKLDVKVLAGGGVALQWPTTSGMIYRLERSVDLSRWVAAQAPEAGDGEVHSFEEGPGRGGFFRLLADPAGRPGTKEAKVMQRDEKDDWKSAEVEPIEIANCGLCKKGEK